MSLYVAMELHFILIIARESKNMYETHFQKIFKSHYSDYSDSDYQM